MQHYPQRCLWSLQRCCRCCGLPGTGKGLRPLRISVYQLLGRDYLLSVNCLYFSDETFRYFVSDNRSYPELNPFKIKPDGHWEVVKSGYYFLNATVKQHLPCQYFARKVQNCKILQIFFFSNRAETSLVLYLNGELEAAQVCPVPDKPHPLTRVLTPCSLYASVNLTVSDELGLRIYGRRLTLPNYSFMFVERIN